jgi:hypothetical protein
MKDAHILIVEMYLARKEKRDARAKLNAAIREYCGENNPSRPDYIEAIEEDETARAARILHDLAAVEATRATAAVWRYGKKYAEDNIAEKDSGK